MVTWRTDSLKQRRYANELNEIQPTELYYELIRADSVVLLKNDNLICH
jgi:hypothetical protein